MKKTALESWIQSAEGLNEPIDREALSSLQLRRLNDLLRRLKLRGGKYAALPESLPTLERLSELPFTTADELAQGAPLLVSQAEVRRIITEATSGTAGPAKRVYYTQGDCDNTAGFFAAGLSELVFPGDTVLIAMPFSGPGGVGDLISRAIVSLGARPLELGVDRSWGEIQDVINAERPQVFVGMPVPLLSLLRILGRQSLRRALVSADACPPRVMAEAERLLGSELFPHYGSRETALGGAVTCAAHRGMHLRENHIIAEIIDDMGVVLPDGREGELVLTTIGMEAMPLLRYRTGDAAAILPEPCPCGGVTRRLYGVHRKGERQMWQLDDALFALPGVSDCRAAYGGGVLTLEVCGDAGLEEITAAVRTLYPQDRLSVTVRPVSMDEGPMYIAKRSITGVS